MAERLEVGVAMNRDTIASLVGKILLEFEEGLRLVQHSAIKYNQLYDHYHWRGAEELLASLSLGLKAIDEEWKKICQCYGSELEDALERSYGNILKLTLERSYANILNLTAHLNVVGPLGTLNRVYTQLYTENSRTLALSALKTLSLHLQSHVWRSSTDHGLQPTNENSRPTGAVAIGDLTHNRVSNAVDVTDPTLNSERSPSIRSTNTFKMELSSFSKRLQARLQRTGSWASRSTFLTADTSQTHRSDVTYVTVNSCAPNTKAYDHPIGPDTKWQAYLRLEGLDPSPRSVIDWSRRGQHVEYHRGEKVPLEPVELLGQGGAAYVESVKCGRILLARKSMRCSARLKREACIQEAKILDKLRHPHLIQLVGTYVQGNTLSILMYPVADCGSLDVFLEQCYREVRNPLVHEYRPLHDRSLLIRPLLIRPLDDRMFALKKFPKCLAMALNFVHENLVKHMDIKPKNILIKKVDDSEDFYRVYIADFGISRTYSDDADTKTDGPTSFTRTYCAPEVAAGEARGRSADIYSLGCVYAEIFTVLAGKRVQDLAEHLGGPFYMNSPKVVSWVGKLEWPPWLAYKYKDEDHSAYSHTAQSLIGLMLKDEPSARATHDLIKSMLDELPDWLYRDDSCCSRVPEKYECYQGLLDEGPIYS